MKHPREFTLAAVSADNIKEFHCKKGRFFKWFQEHLILRCGSNVIGILSSSSGKGCEIDVNTDV